MSDSGDGPRKRLRLDSEQSDSVETQSVVEALSVQEGQESSIKFDPQYNAPDGDICVIRIGETHFKIHRYLLSRDSVIFKDMLSLPQAGTPQGVDPKAPIVLHDNIEEFRTLCWALYALPSELNAQLRADADTNNLRILATIANKYQFLSLEDWAITTLIHHCRTHNFATRIPLNQTPEYLKMAFQCSSKEFQDLLEDGIIKKIENWDVSWKGIIEPFETYGSRRFKGMMHYRLLMLQDHETPKAQPGTSAVLAGIWTDPDSNSARITYRGFFALTKWWEFFLASEGAQTALPRAAACTQEHHQQQCQRQWPTRFRGLVLEIDAIRPKLDVLAKLSRLQELTGAERESYTSFSSYSYSRCSLQWSSHIGEVRQHMIETMADHFYGYTPTTEPAVN